MTPLTVIAAGWLFGIPFALCLVVAVCLRVDQWLERRDRRQLGVLLAFDPEAVPHERRHGGTW